MSIINSNVKSYIKLKLQKIAEEHNVKILIAVESGSRAWGFPSKDSDYDVRFIYANTLDNYLCVNTKRDVIEIPIVFDSFLNTDLDISGWDIRKTLQLVLKSNAIIQEWLTSPIKYISDRNTLNLLQSFVIKTANLVSYSYSYSNMAKKAYANISKNPIKKFN